MNHKPHIIECNFCGQPQESTLECHHEDGIKKLYFCAEHEELLTLLLTEKNVFKDFGE
jgi:hypothetical protein